MQYRAVIFDIGGVIVGSPLHAIAAYEREVGLPAGFINRVVVDSGTTGAWARLERGELDLAGFYPAFERDCERAGCRLSARRLMIRVGEAALPRPAMLEAIGRIRARGLRAGALTNNWISEDGGAEGLRPYFDVFVESAVEGLRKPDPRIFVLACERLGVTPAEAVFLDDIGANLKAARALGMHTIKVDAPEQALAELDAALGVVLLASP
jgi:putative hydrolase of the HAD superfamily